MPVIKNKSISEPPSDDFQSMKRDVELTDAQRVKAVKDTLSYLGTDAFILMYHPKPELNVVHTENMRMDDSIALLLMGIRTILENIQKNPTLSSDYKEMFIAFEKDLKAIIQNHNERFKNFLQKEGR